MCARPGARAARARARSQAASNNGFARISRSAPSGERPGMPRSSAERIEPSPAASLTREIGQRQADKRRPQNRQPGDAIERGVERPRQRFEIAHDGHIRERLELDAENGMSRVARLSRIARRCERAPASTAIDSPGRVAPERGDQIGRTFGFAGRPAIGLDTVDARFDRSTLLARGDTGEMAHRALAHVVGCGEYTREDLVAPVHERRRRTEIPAQLERGRGAGPRARPRERSRNARLRRCGIRRWTASGRRPGTACARRPRDQSCVSVRSSSYWSREVSWNSSTRMCMSRVPIRSANGVGLLSSVSARRAAPAISV